MDEQPRTISDARELRALAHPVRVALYEALARHESLTATQASKLVGGSPTSVAYHLRTLAKYGYVEETKEGAGRERPWKRSHPGYRFGDGTPDPEANVDAPPHARQMLFGTVEEYNELRAGIAKLFDKYRERLSDPSRRPEGWRMFEFRLYTHPVDTADHAIEDEPEN